MIRPLIGRARVKRSRALAAVRCTPEVLGAREAKGPQGMFLGSGALVGPRMPSVLLAM